MSNLKPRPSLENSGGWVKIAGKDPILQVVPYRPERPPKWMFWKIPKEYLAIVTKSQKLYLVDFTKDCPTVNQEQPNDPA